MSNVILVLPLAVFFAALASILMAISVATNHWEITTFDYNRIRTLPGLIRNESYLNSLYGFYKVVRMSRNEFGNLTMLADYVRDCDGGIWTVCDHTTDEFRRNDVFQQAMKSDAPYLRYHCFHYITQYSERKDGVFKDIDRTWLVKVQNSAASCVIVAVMCMLTAIITGLIGILLKQVSICMVTGVMYVVAGVFMGFSLVIMHSKIRLVNAGNYSLDPIDIDSGLFETRNVAVGWSIVVAWLSIAVFMMAFGFWLLLSRAFRLEKAKTMI